MSVYNPWDARHLADFLSGLGAPANLMRFSEKKHLVDNPPLVFGTAESATNLWGARRLVALSGRGPIGIVVGKTPRFVSCGSAKPMKTIKRAADLAIVGTTK